MWYSLLLLGYKPVQHVTVLNTVGNCNTMVSILILWDHRRICGPSLTETSLCGAWLYSKLQTPIRIETKYLRRKNGCLKDHVLLAGRGRDLLVFHEDVSTCPGAYTNSWFSGYRGFFSLEQTGRGMKLPTYLNPKAIPLQAWTSPQGSRGLRLPDFKTIGTWRW